MYLTDAQTESLYEHLLTQIKLKIVDDFGTLSRFAEVSNINRTSVSKLLSDAPTQDMSIGFYYRVIIALGIIKAEGINPRLLESKVTLKDFLLMSDNTILNSITVICNNL